MTTLTLSADSKTELGDYVERIESLMAEKSEVNERIKAEYSEAAGSGFDKKAIQQIIKERAADAQKSIEHREIVETYRRALAGLSGTPLGDWARQWISNDTRIQQRAKDDESNLMADFMKKKSKAKPDDQPPAI